MIIRLSAGKNMKMEMNDLFQKIHKFLPLFAVDCGTYTALYTPGSTLKIGKIKHHDLIEFLEKPEFAGSSVIRDGFTSMLRCAAEVSAKWERKKQEDFYPECLTIHVGSDCNLNCSYCYSRKGGEDNKILRGFPDHNSIITLFRYILKMRADRPGVVTIVFHGSGEPTFHWQKFVNSLRDISEIARLAGQKIFCYLATNCCLDERQVDWLADNIDLIGISCDGPQSARQGQHDIYGKKFLSTERVCRRIYEKGGKFEIRATVTPDTIMKLKEITAYFVEECRAETIRVEPVFLAGENGFKTGDADFFFRIFSEAQDYAEIRGTTLGYAGVRMEELHGAFCDVLRNNLRLTTDDVSRNCFWFMSDNKDYITGSLKRERSSFSLNPGIREIKEKAAGIPETCNDCINIFHCSRGCPDYCVFRNDAPDFQFLNAFRCRLHQLFTIERIKSLTRNQKTIID